MQINGCRAEHNDVAGRASSGVTDTCDNVNPEQQVNEVVDGEDAGGSVNERRAMSERSSERHTEQLVYESQETSEAPCPMFD